ncbi:putative MFS transporter [Whalleya microplaca]|nr:putative MFS transporter [Whalleya microplaca]
MTRSEKQDVIPGTEIIFTGREHGEDFAAELVLIPRPTSNTEDPLNWSPTWKGIVIFNQFVFVFVSIMTPLSISPMTQIFQKEFDKTLPEVNMLFGAAAITLGFANLLVVPAANAFGRRPVILVCSVICILANIWQGLVTSYPSFIGARVISGVGASANETIMPMVIADLLFLHQRGSSMALYFWAYFLGLFLGPIVSGAIAAQMSWRWFFWVCTILQGASFIFILVAHPETKYERPGNAMSPSSTQTDLWAESNKPEGATGTSFEVRSGRTPPKGSSTHITDGRPVAAQFSVLPRFRVNHGIASVIRDVVSPIQILFYPIVLWASLTMGFAANSLLGLNLTQAQVFGPPPYLFTPDQIGFINFAFVVGAIIALVTAGPFSDWIALRRARKNGGVLEAEMRLPALIPYVCTNLVGMVVTAIGYQRSWPWEATVIVGYMLVGLQVVGIPAIAIAYAVDSYKVLPGEIMIAATIVKNTFGFGMIFFFNDWAAQSGYLGPVLMLMALTVGFSVLGLAIFIPFGKKFRRWTKDSKVHNL